MRMLPATMRVILESGVFVGDNANACRATVEPNWWLNVDNDVGNWPGIDLPVRWFQRADNSQVEVEIPNVLEITTDRSPLDQPAASATITLANIKMRPNIPPPGARIPTEIGIRGYYGPMFGESYEAQARWNHAVNEWNDVLVQGALLRSYEGYGGNDLSIPAALAAGNIMITGVWIVDDIYTGTDGQLVLKCRDSMALCVDQSLFPPLVPLSRYPLSFNRWNISNAAINAGAETTTVNIETNVNPGPVGATYADSEVDRWYGSGASLYGHFGADSIDGNIDSYYLGVGNSGPNEAWSFDWVEFDVAGQYVNAIWMYPWMGGYQMFISVMENGIWQGDQVIPYDFSQLPPQGYAVDTGANIPYVTQQGVPFETGQEYGLPRIYAAQRIRLTFTNLVYSDWGVWRYRAGVREFQARISAAGGGATSSSSSSITIAPIFFGGAMVFDPTDLNRAGYLTVSQFFQVDAFGDARELPYSGGQGRCEHKANSIAFTPDAAGYWVSCDRGHVTAYGSAVYYGEPGQPPTMQQTGAILSTPTGLGYWVLDWNGNIYSFGDAAPYAAFTPPGGEVIHQGASHPNVQGLWGLCSNGTVSVRGAAVDYGDYTESTGLQQIPYIEGAQTEVATDITATSTGLGYWILTSAGRVQAFGDAVDYGQIDAPVLSNNAYDRYFQLMPATSDEGYLLLKGDGEIFPIGTVAFFGSPKGGKQLRSDGNYRDWTDIIKTLLLWSGFYLKETLGAADTPGVFGSLETTGAYTDEPLQQDFFDKKKVIDVLNAIAEIVGYLVYAREDGGAVFSSMNWWASGNFDENGEWTDQIPEIDERIRLTDYKVGATKKPLRSRIIVASTKVDPTDASQVYVDYVPETARYLRGMTVPAIWSNGRFTRRSEQQIMAELIALRVWFAMRSGSVTAWCDPSVQCDDQVRILERNSGEAFVHYVRGKSTNNSKKTGRYTHTLTTNWLGTDDQWVITANDIPDENRKWQFKISPELKAFLLASNDKRIAMAARLFEGAAADTALMPDGVVDPGGGQAGGPPP